MSILHLMISTLVASAAARHQSFNDADHAVSKSSPPRKPHHFEKSPNFLKNISSEAQSGYFEIVSNNNLTIADQKSELLIWAQENGVEDEYQVYREKMDEKILVARQNLTDLIAQLPEAQNALLEIMSNEEQTRREQVAAVKLFKEENGEVARALFAIIREFSDDSQKTKPHSNGTKLKDGRKPGPAQEHHRTH